MISHARERLITLPYGVTMWNSTSGQAASLCVLRDTWSCQISTQTLHPFFMSLMSPHVLHFCLPLLVGKMQMKLQNHTPPLPDSIAKGYHYKGLFTMREEHFRGRNKKLVW